MKQIRKGLEDNLNVTVYAKPEFDHWQMDEIRLGLENNMKQFANRCYLWYNNSSKQKSKNE